MDSRWLETGNAGRPLTQVVTVRRKRNRNAVKGTDSMVYRYNAQCSCSSSPACRQCSRSLGGRIRPRSRRPRVQNMR
eukprot:7353798-Prymnesium_polylepis.1